MYHQRNTFAMATATYFFLIQTAIAQTASYAMWFLPGASITSFTTTMIVPSLSIGSGLHGIWPGLENDSDGFVFQDVVGDSKILGQWQFWEEYCCGPDVQTSGYTVSPGDQITNTFALDAASGNWTDSWSVSGSTSLKGSSSNAFTGEGALDKALLAIELQNAALWDFGPVQWTNIAITANTTSYSWCGNAFQTSGSYAYSVSGAGLQISAGEVTCTYSSILFTAPL